MANSIKKFTVQCDFRGQTSPFAIYIGNPKNDTHPIHHQDSWLTKERGGNIPSKVKESLQKLHKLSKENGISLPELCTYAITVINNSDKTNTRKK
ncbi:DUF2610 domain-containing protein [Wolbachia endosymbiont of Dirofilaria (Dirofilaria) immitis]|uniref:DUF2610 domain-containing protein n=1 Tax=Wolbachia endosymbiont of Dirofilaria (Dirofilaria) immitis TaxID=1812115 RepID=UPI00158E7970|nr:DUF2610 domain-containing protein [Wolbachia endosymbiont of Dirofilaria (Dirofilaria) immitis]QKX02109.1 DUF2610 domain-containing protein [Wolbachia endosymbiont of Dirofilaria (Dirofilaria) immitis]